MEGKKLMPMPEYQEMPSYLERVSFSSPEEILHNTLGKKYGQKYLDYRRDYYHSFEADKHGEWPEFAHTVTMEFVNRCNLSCQMCYVANHAFPKATLELDTVKRLIDDIADQGKTGLLLGVGSEGLLYKDIRKVITHAVNVGVMDIILMTNGILLTPEFSEFLVRQEVSRVCISVDAATPETYEKVRGMDELEKLESNIRGLVAARERLRGGALRGQAHRRDRLRLLHRARHPHLLPVRTKPASQPRRRRCQARLS